MKYRRGGKPSDVLKWELSAEFSRETVTLKGGVGVDWDIVIGTPLGMITTNADTTVATVAAAGNTGNGALTLANPAFTSAARPGRYVVTIDTAAADGGKFTVEGPDGQIVGAGAVAAAFAKQVKFTLADGAADYAKGDQHYIDVAVPAGDDTGLVVVWDPDATDGSQVLWGVSLNAVTAAIGEDAVNAVLAVTNHAVLFDGAIVWPDGISAAEKTTALRDLAKRWVKVKA
jgi:hypothetical protein